jgi:glycosyltransferase involved in cell wall biosynthesis
MRILFLTRYNEDGPSSRYRAYNYIPYFDSNNINCTFSPLLDSDYVLNLYNNKKFKTFIQSFFSIFKRIIFLIFNVKKFDLVIIEKELFPNAPYFLEYIFLRNIKYALDYDDYIATGYKENLFKRFYLNNKIQKLVKGAKFVTVCNRWYFEQFKTDNLFYLPTVVNLDNYSKIKNTFESKVITIVWIGSPSTVKYLQNIVPILKLLSLKYLIKLKVIGAEILIDGVNVEFVEWTPENENEELFSSDIGIMPLNDSMWDKGKCGFKLVQYMATGLPVIATVSPANNEIISNGLNGFIINDINEWYFRLEELILNKELREQFGKSGRYKIEFNYTYQVWGNRFVKYILNA